MAALIAADALALVVFMTILPLEFGAMVVVAGWVNAVRGQQRLDARR